MGYVQFRRCEPSLLLLSSITLTITLLSSFSLPLLQFSLLSKEIIRKRKDAEPLRVSETQPTAEGDKFPKIKKRGKLVKIDAYRTTKHLADSSWDSLIEYAFELNKVASIKCNIWILIRLQEDTSTWGLSAIVSGLGICTTHKSLAVSSLSKILTPTTCKPYALISIPDPTDPKFAKFSMPAACCVQHWYHTQPLRATLISHTRCNP